MDPELYKAAKRGKIHALGKFPSYQILERVSPQKNTALHIAASNGHVSFVMKLVEIFKADIEVGHQFLGAVNKEGNTALHDAAQGGHESVVELLLKEDCNLAQVKNCHGETALFKAAEEGHTRIVNKLLHFMPDEGYTRTDGQTPLHRAVFRQHKDVIEKLLQRPGITRIADEHGRTPLHIAALIPAVLPISQLKLKRISQIGEILLKHDGDLCCRVDKKGQTALHIAAKEGNAYLVEKILQHNNLCIEMVDNDGRNALHLAVMNASKIFYRVGYSLKTIISSVMEKNLVDCADNNGHTALDLAIQKIEEDPQLFIGIRNYLLRCGATRKIMFQDETTNKFPSIFEKSKWKTEIISINAVLIATVAFTVAFTLPGGLQSHDPTPALIDAFIFKVFVLSDTLALCFSISSAVLLFYALLGNGTEDPLLTGFSFNALWIALVSLAFTFGAAIHLVVAPKCPWLTALVWLMVCILPVAIWLFSFSGKLYMFKEHKFYVRYVILDSFVQLMVALGHKDTPWGLQRIQY
ncbi:uncharacterized protein LOC131061792 [Cryptomeria japonica]|uniref:uncharacterized protein LOC131061792 n=1 Tax=Cryptomeria japonica TaxID=3369 RepID=UPI0025AC4DB8|nr:uncharacterized protein LOC131061792 [Cryptomeria japonica]